MDTNQAKLIIKAAKSGNLESIKNLLESDKNLINAQDRDGSLPLHCAAWKGHEHIVTYLIEAGSDIHAENNNAHWGTTPLHAASHGNQKKVAEILISNGANIHYRSPLNKLTPLGHTKVHNARAVAKLLTEAGAKE